MSVETGGALDCGEGLHTSHSLCTLVRWRFAALRFFFSILLSGTRMNATLD